MEHYGVWNLVLLCSFTHEMLIRYIYLLCEFVLGGLKYMDFVLKELKSPWKSFIQSPNGHLLGKYSKRRYQSQKQMFTNT